MFHKQATAIAMLLALVLSLEGCSATGKSSQAAARKPVAVSSKQPANEALLRASDNHAALIELYKSRLPEATQPAQERQLRLQLGQTYLAMNDAESALFTLKPLLDKKQGNADIWLLQSRAQLALGHVNNALESASKAEKARPKDPYILNQKALVFAETGQYQKARTALDQARKAMLDDRTVKNNMAMLDILEHKYSAAIKRLMPLYTSGQADEMIRANLVVALAKAGLYNEFRTVYSSSAVEQELIALFVTLSEARLTGHASRYKGRK